MLDKTTKLMAKLPHDIILMIISYTIIPQPIELLKEIKKQRKYKKKIDEEQIYSICKWTRLLNDIINYNKHKKKLELKNNLDDEKIKEILYCNIYRNLIYLEIESEKSYRFDYNPYRLHKMILYVNGIVLDFRFKNKQLLNRALGALKPKTRDIFFYERNIEVDGDYVNDDDLESKDRKYNIKDSWNIGILFIKKFL